MQYHNLAIFYVPFPSVWAKLCVSRLASMGELNGAVSCLSTYLSVSLPALGCLCDHYIGITDNRPFEILLQLKLNP